MRAFAIRSKSEQNVRQDPIPRVREAALCTPAEMEGAEVKAFVDKTLSLNLSEIQFGGEEPDLKLESV